jgi:hypothetical protein
VATGNPTLSGHSVPFSLELDPDTRDDADADGSAYAEPDRGGDRSSHPVSPISSDWLRSWIYETCRRGAGWTPARRRQVPRRLRRIPAACCSRQPAHMEPQAGRTSSESCLRAEEVVHETSRAAGRGANSARKPSLSPSRMARLAQHCSSLACRAAAGATL